METLIKRVRNISRKNNYNLTDPIEQYYRLVTGLVNLEYADMNFKKEQMEGIIGELMFDLIVLCDTLNIDFHELYEHADTFNYPIEDIDTIRIGALILSVVNNPDNERRILDLKNHIIFFIEALVTETLYLPAPITVKTALKNCIKRKSNSEKTEDVLYSKYMQNIGMNS